MSHSTKATKELLDDLKAAEPRRRRPPRQGTDRIVFGVAAAVAILFVVWGIVSPDNLGDVASSALDGVITHFGWLYVIAATVFTLFVLVVAFSRFGRIPLGRDGEEPQFGTASWVSMMFATGMGIGLIFYGVGEPLFFYMSPPPGTVEGQTPEAMTTAMGTTLFHWTLYPWAMYAIVGLGMAYGTYRLGRAQLFSAMFSSIFGERVSEGVGGRVINILAIIATLFGSACSLGLGALQIGGGIESTGILSDVGSPVLVLIIAILTACFVASAVSGIERGIQWLSNTNMVLAVLLALIVFIGGPTLFILNVIPNAVGGFIADLPQMASRTAASGDQTLSDWMGTWTIFYWAWWVSWSPFVGLFIGRISRGRTIRQFVVGVLLVPSIVSLLWFSIFGGGAIGVQERAEAANDPGSMLSTIVDGSPDINFDLVLFSMLESLPVPGIITLVLMVLAVILIAIFFVTGADSASIVMGGLSERGAEEPTKKSVVFWGVATGAVAAIMLLAGGDEPSEALNGLKNITIVSSLPFVIVMLLLCVAIWKDLSKDPLMIRSKLARHVLEDSVDTAVERHDGEPFELRTVEAVVETAPADDAPADSTPVDDASTKAAAAAQADAPGAETPEVDR
ncbi:BCCT family transporter [Brachybacterium sp. DNPG3]